MSVLRSLPEVNGGSHPGLPFWHPRLNCQMLHPYTPPATNAGGNELESCLTLLRTLSRRCFCGRCATCSFGRNPRAKRQGKQVARAGRRRCPEASHLRGGLKG